MNEWVEYGIRLRDGTCAPASGMLVAWRHANALLAEPVARVVTVDPAFRCGSAEVSTSAWRSIGAAA